MKKPPKEVLKEHYSALDEKVRLFPEETKTIRSDVLLTLPYDYPEREVEVVIDTEEFTALCPWTGLPDFGKLSVSYVPDRNCIELKSLKYYLLTFRLVGILQEHAANRILEDLVRACKPKRMALTLDYRVRGGLHTVVTVRYP